MKLIYYILLSIAFSGFSCSKKEQKHKAPNPLASPHEGNEPSVQISEMPQVAPPQIKPADEGASDASTFEKTELPVGELNVVEGEKAQVIWSQSPATRNEIRKQAMGEMLKRTKADAAGE